MRSTAPAWASAAPKPWQSYDLSASLRMQEHVSELNETRALGASLRDQPPIDVAVPLDGDWHKLTDQPVINPHQPKGGTANQASPESSMNEVSKRRAARRKQDWARAKSMQQTTMNARNNSGEDGRYGRYGGDVPSSVDPTNADVVWAARKQRIQDLIYDDEASVSSLKRELKLLLGYADVARSAASEERCRLAVELNEMVTPLVQEVRRLKRKLAQAEAQPAKADETAPHVDAEEGTGEDTLRSGKGDGDVHEAHASKPPPPAMAAPALRPATRDSGGKPGGAADGDSAASTAAASEGGEVGASLSRREKQGVSRRVEAATSAVERGSSPEDFLSLLDSGDSYLAMSASTSMERCLVAMGLEAFQVRNRLTAAKTEARLIRLLVGAEKKATTAHRAYLNLLERLVSGHTDGADAVRDANGGARLHAILKSWARAHVQTVNGESAEPRKDHGRAGGKDAPTEGARGGGTHLGASFLPHLLLLLIALAESSDDARDALVRCGMVPTLLGLLEGPPTSEATLLAIETLRALGVNRLDELCEQTEDRLKTLLAVEAMTMDERAEVATVSGARREESLDAAISQRAAAAATKAGEPMGKEDGGAGGTSSSADGAKLSRRDRLRTAKSDGTAPAPDAAAPSSEPPAAAAPAQQLVRLPLRGDQRKPMWAPLVRTGQDAERVVVRCRANGLRRGGWSVSEDARRINASLFVAVSVEMRWGSLVELGRSESRFSEDNGWCWEEMDFELPHGLPAKVYLRFAVYEGLSRFAAIESARGGGLSGRATSPGRNATGPQRPKLIGMAGATIEDLRAEDRHNRGAPLMIHAPPTGRDARPLPRGTLWIERYDLVGEPLPPSKERHSRSKSPEKHRSKSP